MIWSVIQTITILDIIGILLMSYLIYLLIKLVRETRASQLIKGIFIVVLVYFSSNLIGFKSITYVTKTVLDVGLLAIIIMFQPEIRRALEKAGRTKFGMKLFNFSDQSDELKKKWAKAIDAICDSCGEFSLKKTGALIVLERQTKLGEHLKGATIINATLSRLLLESIFFPYSEKRKDASPLHDGAMIVRDAKILAAGCHLPLSQNDEFIDKKLGTRHRAAIGMSENSDAIVVVVSEETGQISIANNGVLTRDYTVFTLKEYLHDAILPDPQEQKKPLPVRFLKKFKGDDKK